MYFCTLGFSSLEVMVVVLSIKFLVWPTRVDVDQSLDWRLFSPAHSVVSQTVDSRNKDLCVMLPSQSTCSSGTAASHKSETASFLEDCLNVFLFSELMPITFLPSVLSVLACIGKNVRLC